MDICRVRQCYHLPLAVAGTACGARGRPAGQAAIEQRYKLEQALSFSRPAPPNAPLELYDLIEDPGETTDIAARHPAVVERLTNGYDRWLADVSASRGYRPVRFTIGSDRQPHVTLTRQDWWRMVTADGWGRDQSCQHDRASGRGRPTRRGSLT